MAWTQDNVQSTLACALHVIYGTHLFGCNILRLFSQATDGANVVSYLLQDGCRGMLHTW